MVGNRSSEHPGVARRTVDGPEAPPAALLSGLRTPVLTASFAAAADAADTQLEQNPIELDHILWRRLSPFWWVRGRISSRPIQSVRILL